MVAPLLILLLHSIMGTSQHLAQAFIQVCPEELTLAIGQPNWATINLQVIEPWESEHPVLLAVLRTHNQSQQAAVKTVDSLLAFKSLAQVPTLLRCNMSSFESILNLILFAWYHTTESNSLFQLDLEAAKQLSISRHYRSKKLFSHSGCHQYLLSDSKNQSRPTMDQCRHRSTLAPLSSSYRIQ